MTDVSVTRPDFAMAKAVQNISYGTVPLADVAQLFARHRTAYSGRNHTDQTVTQALEPCPFCRGEARLFTIGENEPENAGGDVISCTKCGASSHVEFGRKENLVDRWNTRTAHSGDLAPGLERAALWHDARCKGPDVFEQELHEVSAKALRHLAANPDATDMQALDAAHSGEGRSNGAGEDAAVGAITFEQAWAQKEAEGYRYGSDALENVRFGWEIAAAALSTYVETPGRFTECSTESLAAQCRMQARENLDPEYSQFMVAVADRLAALAQPEAGGGRNDIEPLLDGCDSPEPSLREIVRRYYSRHFDQRRADELTDDYFAALSRYEGAKSD